MMTSTTNHRPDCNRDGDNCKVDLSVPKPVKSARISTLRPRTPRRHLPRLRSFPAYTATLVPTRVNTGPRFGSGVGPSGAECPAPPEPLHPRRRSSGWCFRSAGSFLRTGNTSLMIGVEDEGVQGVLGILRRTARRRTQIAVPYSPALEPGLLYMPENFEVEVGGAVVFVAEVSRFERI